MIIATLGTIVRRNEVGRDQVLLGLCKRGFAKGRLNSPGGKLEEGETILECLMREVEKEVGLKLDPKKTEKTAIITFYAGGERDFEVHVYRTDHFSGELCESDEMTPGWYEVDDLPIDWMLESDSRWFPQAIRGEKFCANVFYRQQARDFQRIEFLPFVDSE